MGIIGGADGPTVFVLGNGFGKAALFVGLALAAVAVFLAVKKRRKK